MKSLIKWSVLFAGLAMLQACAFVDQTVNLDYTPQGYAPKGSGEVVTGAPQSAFINEVNAKGQLVVGTVRNGFNMKTADVIADQDPAEWISNALAEELKLAGYTVVPSDKPIIDDAPKAIELTVTRVFADQDTGLVTVGAISTLNYEIVVKSNGTKLLRLPVHYSGDVSDRSLIGNESLKSASLKEALERSLSEAMPKVLEALLNAQTS